MLTAKIKRHTKKLLKHPLQLPMFPLIIAGVAVGYMFAIAIFGYGFKTGSVYTSRKMLSPVAVPTNRPNGVNPGVYPKPEVFNLEPSAEELLQMDESDETLKQELDNLLNSLDYPELAYGSTTEVLGTYDSYKPTNINEENIPSSDSDLYRRSYPVEKRIYTDIANTPTPTETEVNFLATGSVISLFSIKSVILPVISMALAVFGVNIIEHKSSKRRALLHKHKKVK